MRFLLPCQYSSSVIVEAYKLFYHIFLLLVGGPLQMMVMLLLSQRRVSSSEPTIRRILRGHDVMDIPESHGQ